MQCRPRRFFPVLVVFVLCLIGATALHAQPGGMTNAPRPGGGYQDSSAIPAPGRWRQFTPEQDSAYQEAMKLNLQWEARMQAELRLDSLGLVAFLDSLANTPEAIRRRNLTFDPKTWQPTAAEQARRNADIAQALDWDELHPNLPFTPLVAVPLKSIGQALGLTEDTSPNIKYTLTRTQHVSVKVFDPMANEVVTLVDDVQRPGVYSFAWDMRDASGLRVRFGDYVAEVIGDKQLLLRKRIEVP